MKKGKIICRLRLMFGEEYSLLYANHGWGKTGDNNEFSVRNHNML